MLLVRAPVLRCRPSVLAVTTLVAVVVVVVIIIIITTIRTGFQSLGQVDCLSRKCKTRHEQQEQYPRQEEQQTALSLGPRPPSINIIPVACYNIL